MAKAGRWKMDMERAGKQPGKLNLEQSIGSSSSNGKAAAEYRMKKQAER